jgi:hypothetical protein
MLTPVCQPGVAGIPYPNPPQVLSWEKVKRMVSGQRTTRQSGYKSVTLKMKGLMEDLHAEY